MRRIWLALGIVAVCAAACRSSTIGPVAPALPQCPSDGPTQCFLEDFALSENGQPVELVDAIQSAFEGNDGGVLVTSVPAPQITNQPAGLVFSPDGTPQDIALDFTDPTGNRPSFMWTLRPANTSNVRCFAPCCFGCRVTRRVHDGASKGSVHYSLAVNAVPTTPTVMQLVIYPIVSSQPDQDPATALARDRSEAGSLTAAEKTLGMGPPVTIPVKLVAPSGGSSGGTSSGASGTSGTTGCNHPATCSSDADCSDFATKNCAGPAPWKDPSNGARCDTDGLCHCCVGTCTAPAGGGPATSCVCGACGPSCVDRCAPATSTCVNSLGGHPCD